MKNNMVRLKDVFPTTTCRTCHGTGHKSPGSVIGFVCDDCEGDGTVFTDARVHDAAMEYREHLQDARRIIVAELEQGTRVMYLGKFRTVESVTVDHENRVVIFTDGMSTESLKWSTPMTRTAWVDWKPYAAKCGLDVDAIAARIESEILPRRR
jgi:hypothetical protein